MKTPILTSIFLILVLFIQIPAASAWNWNTHQEIVENNYNSLPTDIKQNLNLDAMKDGSDDPDFKFFDFKYHSYPNSYGKADEWLNRGQEHYKNGDYYYASYCYGVASHYIADSFAAPHCAGVSGPDHTLYEAQASFLRPEMTNSNGDLNSVMSEGVLSGKSDWNDWLKTKSNLDIQNDMNKATGASYASIYNSLNDAYPIEEKKSNSNSEFLMSLAFLI